MFWTVLLPRDLDRRARHCHTRGAPIKCRANANIMTSPCTVPLARAQKHALELVTTLPHPFIIAFHYALRDEHRL